MWKGGVLIVDDEELIRWSLEKGLRKEGYRIFLADTGELSLKKLKREVELLWGLKAEGDES